jgi:CheY-like chemotaxis protein
VAASYREYKRMIDSADAVPLATDRAQMGVRRNGYVEGGLRQAHILVVDDDSEVREILAETLGEFGYSVMQAASGEEALPLLSAHSEIDMLISDVRMPGMSGLELAEIAREYKSDLKVILMSGYFLPQPVKDRFLKKPFHMQELASAVRAALG